MAISDIYTGRGSVSVSSSSQTPLLSLLTVSTKRAWIVGVRVEVVTSAAAAGNQSQFILARSGNGSSMTATGSATGVAQDSSAPAALLSFASTWSTAPTQGTILADWTIPQTTGSAWEEFPPLGYEWGAPAIASGTANYGVNLFVTAGSASATTYVCNFIWSE